MATIGWPDRKLAGRSGSAASLVIGEWEDAAETCFWGA